jgi:hypothetical protein
MQTQLPAGSSRRHVLNTSRWPGVITLIAALAATSISYADLPDMPAQNVPQPSPAPATPSGWDVFTPAVTATPPASGTPTIAEWTRIGAPDDSLILTGDAFSNNTAYPGNDTQFLVYGQTTNSDAIQLVASIQQLDGLKAAITLPTGLPVWSTYFVWPKNSSGYGIPVGINRTDAWWVGPDQATQGDTVSVYGRNLSHNNGTTTSWVYIKPAGAAVAGQWVTVTSVNPYRVQFTVPSTLSDGVTPFPNGTYEVWVHNGHGGSYGWSGPLTLTVAAPYAWPSDPGSTFNVQNYGAIGQGDTNPNEDDTAAINSALLAAEIYAYSDGRTTPHPATVYFPAGTYLLSQGIGMSNSIRFMGAGMNSTILRCNAAFASSNSAGLLSCGGTYSQNIDVRDMTLDTNQVLFSTWSYALNVGSNRCDNFHLTNTCVKELYVPGSYIEGCAGFTSVTHLTISGCTFIGGEVFLDDGYQVAISNCTFDNDSGSIRSLGPRGESEFSVTNCTARDDYDPGSPGQGRFIAASSDFCTQSNYYIGNNTTSLTPPLNNNSGEQVLCEGGYSQDEGSPTAEATNPVANTSTATFSNLNLNLGGTTDGTGNTAWAATIVSGKGLGQYRLITGYDAGAQTITVSPAWNVLPDANSIVIIGRAADKWVVYHNDLEGNPNLYNQIYSAMTAIEPYGGCYDWVGDSNTIKYMFSGLCIAEIQQNPAIVNSEQNQIVSINPCYFNYYTNNIIQSCFEGIRTGSDNPTITSNQNFGTGFLGTVFRNNTVAATVGAYENTDATAASYSPSGVTPGVTMDMTLFEHNSFTIEPNLFPSAPESAYEPTGFDCDFSTHYYNPPLDTPVVQAQDAVLYKNTFALDPTTPPSGTIGIYFATTTLNPTLRENTWTGFATTYAGTPPGAIIQAPARNFAVSGTSGSSAQTATLTICNSGTAPLSWTATSNVAWLTLSLGSGSQYRLLRGSIADQNSSSILTLTCNPAGLQPGIYTGMVTILGASPAETIEVDFTVSPPTPVPCMPPWAFLALGGLLFALLGAFVYRCSRAERGFIDFKGVVVRSW